MRRVATLIVAIGLTLSGIGTWGATRHGAPGRPPAAARLTRLALGAGRGGTVPVKMIRYRGYAIAVPAGWPVYRLDRDPARCVRYDRSAVYLGPPGADQQCPAHLVGRADTISLEVGGPAAPPVPGPQWQRPAPGLSLGPLQAGGMVRQDPQDHQVWGSLQHQGLTVSATYGTDPGLVSRIISTLRRSGPATSPGATPPAASPGVTSLAVGPVAGRTAAAVLTRAAGQGRPALVRDQSRKRFRHRILRGFDTCATPSLRTMRKWHRVFSAMAIYIGGPEAACGYGNLSARWVRAVTAMGWSLIPTYVGRQAPCTRFRVKINVGRARMEGRAAAWNAMALAASLGIGRGAPIYDDMENYNDGRGICRRQVLSFLNAWTRELHRHGYRSGVYSSAGSGARNLGRARTVYRWHLAKPNSIWFALWDRMANLRGTPYLLQSWWAGGHRLKQWMGPHRRRIGGVALNIDSDIVAGAVYR